MRSAHYWTTKLGGMIKAIPQEDGKITCYESVKKGDQEYWSPNGRETILKISKKNVSGPETWTPAQARTNYALSRWGNEAFYNWEFARRQFRLVEINGVLTAEECLHGTWYPVYISPDCDPIFHGLLRAARDVSVLLASRDTAVELP